MEDMPDKRKILKKVIIRKWLLRSLMGLFIGGMLIGFGGLLGPLFLGTAVGAYLASTAAGGALATVLAFLAPTFIGTIASYLTSTAALTWATALLCTLMVEIVYAELQWLKRGLKFVTNPPLKFIYALKTCYKASQKFTTQSIRITDIYQPSSFKETVSYFFYYWEFGWFNPNTFVCSLLHTLRNKLHWQIQRLPPISGQSPPGERTFDTLESRVVRYQERGRTTKAAFYQKQLTQEKATPKPKVGWLVIPKFIVEVIFFIPITLSEIVVVADTLPYNFYRGSLKLVTGSSKQTAQKGEKSAGTAPHSGSSPYGNDTFKKGEEGLEEGEEAALLEPESDSSFTSEESKEKEGSEAQSHPSYRSTPSGGAKP